MDNITGRFATASVFAANIEDYARSQIRMILDNQVSINSKVCIMPDCHPGKVGPIGLTMTVNDKIIPQLMGVDIGCGMLVCKFKAKSIEFAKLDRVIRDSVPSGFCIRKVPHSRAGFEAISDLRSLRAVNGDEESWNFRWRQSLYRSR